MWPFKKKKQENLVHLVITRDKNGRTKVYLNGFQYSINNSTVETWIPEDNIKRLQGK